jgi:tetratricopeptide (TPR) repeat protein
MAPEHVTMIASRSFHFAVAVLVLLAGGWLDHGPGWAAEPPAAGSPDVAEWKEVRSLLLKGDYRGAAAAADQLLDRSKPKSKDPDFIPATVAHVQALLARGFAERQLGDLDAAEASLDEAIKKFRDQDFQRLLKLSIRQGGATILPKIVPLELTWLELIQLRSSLLIDRLESGEDGDAASPDAAAAREAIDGWLAELDRLAKLGADARIGLPERLAKAGGTLAGSPYNQALAAGFQATLTDGAVFLKLAHLPFFVERSGRPRVRRSEDQTDSTALLPPTTEERTTLLTEASTQFAAASRILAAAEQVATPKSGGLKPDQRAEAQRLRADLLGYEAAARLAAGDTSRASVASEEALALTESALTLQKNPAGTQHPDLVAPLLLAADVAVAQADSAFAENNVTQARTAMVTADRILDRAAQLLASRLEAFPEAHPFRRREEEVRGRLRQLTARLAADLPRSDAADAAARRAIRSLEAMAPSSVSF